jgi:hypothetical protein
VFDISSRGATDELVATPWVVSAETTATATHAAGQTYTVRAGQFHATVVPASGAATVVLGRHWPDGTDRSLGPPSLATHTVRRLPCSEADRQAAVRLLRERLAA